jgi:hypothetical protein
MSLAVSQFSQVDDELAGLVRVTVLGLPSSAFAQAPSSFLPGKALLFPPLGHPRRHIRHPHRPLLNGGVARVQIVYRLTMSRALFFLHLHDFHERTHDRHRVRPQVKPLAVTALVGELAMKRGLKDGAALEEREQLERYR